MNRKLEIETKLERSLRTQVTSPKLGGGFNASVWARIEAENQKAIRPTVTHANVSGRWLLACNVAGALVALVLAAAYGLRSMVGFDVNVELPQVSFVSEPEFQKIFVWTLTGGVLVFALMFTSLGRRLRNEFF